MQRLLQRHSFSSLSNVATHSTLPFLMGAQPPPSILLPTRHSRQRLPAVVTDLHELSDLASSLMQTEIGHLFTYRMESTKNARDVATSRDAAWHTADATVQRVEAVVRGCASHIVGTRWNRWSTSTSTSATVPTAHTDVTTELLDLQHQVVNRIYQEGHAYMMLRSIQLEERYGPKTTSDETAAAFLPLDPETDELDESNDDSSESAHVHEFALPGPTIDMYDTLLDTLCHATTYQSASDCLDTANFVHTVAMTRHFLDGGDATNTNPVTRPTAVTFNAVLRLVARLNVIPLDDVVVRDDALTTAWSTWQAMHECGVVHRNSASYVYMLQCLATYMPVSSHIGENIARGLFHQARMQGLVNAAVVEAYRAVMSKDDGDRLDARAIIPSHWKRHSRKRQAHPREDVY